MKKMMLLIMALTLFISVPAAFAEGLSASLFNSARESRKVELRITTASGSGSMQARDISPMADAFCDYWGHDDEDQTWEFKVSGKQNKGNTQATIYYSGGKFKAGQIGDGLVFTPFEDKEFKLEITK
ncbi:hypothetical protein [Pseudodesulfovibrio sp.]|uniref:hypothetical protein n=1 Tax=unclassified Pseudodesulfovibrio TaxID=2661612 RepID=UPI003B00E1C0